MGRYFNEKVETMPVEDIKKLQSELLVKQVKHAYEDVPFYKAKMDAMGVKPEDIKGIEDLHKLPFTTKDDLRENYPYGLMGVPKDKVVRIQSTSGTTGRRVVKFYTMEDILAWDECCARAIVAAGGDKSDTCQVCYGYGLFTGGPGLNGGSHMVGCMTVPMSSGNTDRQLQFMVDLESTILCCTPSYAAYLAESVVERGLQDKIKLKAGIFGAEAWSEEMRHDIESKLGIKAYDIYGLTELGGPGVSFECEEQKGMHINEDHYLAEIIDPNTLEQLPNNTYGEIVFTSLTDQAFPLLRYRTRDVCILNDTPCSCGRTHIRMGKLKGRSDDMLIVKGVNVFPSQIETVLINNGYSPNYQIVVDRPKTSDIIDVYVEMNPEMVSDNLADIAKREKELVAALKSMLGILVGVHLVQPKSIVRSEGKAVRVIDKRKI